MSYENSIGHESSALCARYIYARTRLFHYLQRKSYLIVRSLEICCSILEFRASFNCKHTENHSLYLTASNAFERRSIIARSPARAKPSESIILLRRWRSAPDKKKNQQLRLHAPLLDAKNTMVNSRKSNLRALVCSRVLVSSLCTERRVVYGAARFRSARERAAGQFQVRSPNCRERG